MTDYYVRPSATPGTYGLEDGTSYANAWNGLTNIDWTLIGYGDVLWVAGTHTAEDFVINSDDTGGGSADCTIRGDYSGDPGIIDRSAASGTYVVDLEDNCPTGAGDMVIKNLEVRGGNYSAIVRVQNAADRVRLESVTAVGDNSSNTTGLLGTCADRLDITDPIVRDCRTGITLSASGSGNQDGVVSGGKVSLQNHANSQGIIASNTFQAASGGLVISGVEITGWGEEAIDLFSANNVTINSVWAHHDNGLGVGNAIKSGGSSTTGTDIVGNVVNDVTGYGISNNGGQGTSISGNLVLRCGDRGIVVNDSYTNVNDNHIFGCAGLAMDLTDTITIGGFYRNLSDGTLEIDSNVTITVGGSNHFGAITNNGTYTADPQDIINKLPNFAHRNFSAYLFETMDGEKLA